MIGDVVEVLWFLPLMLVAIKFAAELRVRTACCSSTTNLKLAELARRSLLIRHSGRLLLKP